jgi:hypothetical protein
MDINEVIQEALKENRFFRTKKNGKLIGLKPEAGWVAVFEDKTTGLVIKPPNSVGDLLVQLSDGTRIRENICNNNINGYLKLAEKV